LYTPADPVNNPSGKFAMAVSIACVSMSMSLGASGISKPMAMAKLWGININKPISDPLYNFFETFPVFANELILGYFQGWANILNGFQDAIIGILNFPGYAVNLFAWGLGKGTPVPFIISPDWSSGMFVGESDTSHAISKFLGGQGILTLVSLGVSQLGSASNLSHMTSKAGHMSITNDGAIVGRSGIFALNNASTGSNSVWINWIRTMGASTTDSIEITGAAVSQFRPIPVVGPISAFTRMMGGFMANGTRLELTSGLLTGVPLQYPVLIDFLEGMGIRIGGQFGNQILNW
jgi:hypothetical protein